MLAPTCVDTNARWAGRLPRWADIGHGQKKDQATRHARPPTRSERFGRYNEAFPFADRAVPAVC